MFGLTASEIKLVRDFFNAYPQVQKVQVFGSRAIGTFRPNSDIDLVLWGPTDSRLLIQIKNRIDELPLPYLFDIHSL